MNTFIALLRGINVGGNNILPMKELRALLENLNFSDVRTYIQSGNVVFQSEHSDSHALSREISTAIAERYGFTPQVLVLEPPAFKEATEQNPFPEAESNPKALHLFFLAGEPDKPDTETLEQLKTDSERFKLSKSVFYLHAPDGIGRSKLAARVEKTLGIAVTARNWRSVCKIKELVEGSR